MIIKQLTPELGKLMEETSIFWVDLVYKLRGRKRVQLQSSRGVIDTLVLFLFLLYMLYMLPDYLAVGPGSAPRVWAVVRDPGMHATHLKHRQCLQPISFNNIGP